MGMGNRVLGVAGGTLDLHGEPRAGWTRLAATAPAGATQLVLASAPAWRAGDKLVVASTDFDPNRAEVVTVTARSGTVVTLAQPLAYAHYGELQTIAGRTVDERAEVGLLTRNIVIQGDSATSAGGFGGHLIGMGGTLRVEGVELHFMGQKGLMARYPMHWHVMGPVDGQYFAGSSVWKSFNRCVTVHGTDNARVEGNVCHDHLGHGYFLEDGAETGNLIAGNLGLGTHVTAPGEGVLPSDTRAATFWITNPDNTIRGNAAAGSEAFGFWYALPASPTGLSTGSPRLPRSTPAARVQRQRGPLQPARRPQRRRRPDGRREHRGHHLRAAHRPGRRRDRRRGRLHGTHGVQAHRPRGLAPRARPAAHDAVLADNAIGATFASSETFVEDALFVGESANNGGGLSRRARPAGASSSTTAGSARTA